MFVGAPGESNRLQVAVDGDGVLLHDALPITAAPAACTVVDASTVRCPSSRYTYEARLGDGDDVAEIASAPGYGGPALEGGPGDDLLTGTWADGGPGDDTLIAPAGGDGLTAAVLAGGPGADRLLGAAAPSVRFVGGPGPDLLDGGAAEATADYRDSPAGVQVALGGRVGGGDAQGDVLQGIEHVLGSPFADVLTGDEGANELAGESPYSASSRSGPDTIDGGAGDDDLTGSGGRDTLAGGTGDDTLTGDWGDDRVSGGDGDDRVAGGDGADRVDGGAGDDVVDLSDDRDSEGAGEGEVAGCGAGADLVVALRDILGRDCERLDASSLTGDATMRARPVRIGGGRVVLAVPCDPVYGPRCTFEAILRARGRVVVRQRIRLRPGTRRVVLAVPDGVLRRLPALGITVRDRHRYADASYRVAYTVRLRDTG